MIRVELKQHTQAGSIEYSRDSETDQHLLFLRSSLNQIMTFNLNINGGIIIFGTNEQRIITSLEINVPRKRWHVVNNIAIPKSSGFANIQLVDLTSRHTETELPVTVYCDAKYSYVHVRVGVSENNSTWTALSKNCLASLEDSYLTGFFINLMIEN